LFPWTFSKSRWPKFIQIHFPSPKITNKLQQQQEHELEKPTIYIYCTMVAKIMIEWF
jgi:hypothetical protein